MNLRFVTLIVGVLAMAPAAYALDVPQQASSDPRVRLVNYNEDDVVALYARPTMATHLVFAPGEEILDIATGFSAGWEFKNRRNNLYFKARSAQATGEVAGLIPPAPGKWDTNLLVTTNQRVYSFALNLVGDRDPRSAYRVTFRYPAVEAAARQAAEAAQTARVRLDAAPPVRNASYTMRVGKRSKAIEPATIYDDGRFTYIQFPANREFPSVFLVSSDKDRTETLVNSHVEGGNLVVQQLAPEIVLRLGKQVVHIYNKGYDANGVEGPGSTTVQGVERVIKQETFE